MRIRATVASTGLALVALLGLVACEGTDTTNPKAGTSNAGDGSKASKASTANLPNMVGKGLQSAQDQAQAAGFFSLTSHDALGRARMQAFDRNWKVCSQTPKPGNTSTDTTVDFGAVKLNESCPSTDQSEPQDAKGTMPDFQGKSVKAARQSLDSSTSITVNDTSGQDRMIMMESNWQVCSQTPAAGSKLNGQPVTLDAVKFGEAC